MASHPYISGAGNITQMIGFLRKSFPTTVTSDTVKKLGLASKNESYVINVLQFLGLIDEQGKRTDVGHDAMTKHDESEFQSSFSGIVKKAYADLFELRGDDAWTMNKDQLISYFRSADKTSDVIGSRQAGVFIALRELAGYMAEQSQPTPKTKSAITTKPKSSPKKARPAEQKAQDQVFEQDPSPLPPKTQKGDIALTVRVEINLPAEGTQETYDAIFRSIKANLYP
ncbi:DUF5343 domain-containing protein [Mesorhizobium sp. CA4]|uniref:DUF5343 domain-containing protein n=1 Tax=Mesorhizobium sp. CA4 TaxID=588499 RepID=UPI001CD09426|nr:DUF5343 domain-containing protein [Mesorhizobium sp. CA4]MBZ9822978.1 DUF5343 domain-containing protein [Mesorhizobium sp. CA4]